MFKRPNESVKPQETKVKNDLYRKFHNYILGATEKDFSKYDAYSVEGYISVHPEIEERINDTLSNCIDEIVPITGATGIGKTYLFLYCLKKYYNVKDIPANTPILFKLKNREEYDLVYYSDFNITEPSVLENPLALNLAKIKAMYEYILKSTELNAHEITDVADFIRDNKLEITFYTDDNKRYEEALFQLTMLLNCDNLPISNIVFAFDDLESLREDQQFMLMETFLSLYENLKSKSHGKYCSKFFFCLRNSTYDNIYRQDFYNTHRASKAAYISEAPSLSQLFQTRFDIILASEKVKKAKNKKTWEKAKEILIMISNRIDGSYNNILLNLNNNNISKALDSMLEIISNRRWTQKNVNPAASFSIEEGAYYINDINILRILSMGEKNVYFPTMYVPIRCILPDPGSSPQEDLTSLLILRAFRYANRSKMEDSVIGQRLVSLEQIINVLLQCIVPSSENRQTYNRIYNEIKFSVKKAFEYYVDNRFIHKNVNPRVSDDEKYFMLPRGEQIFDLFFSQSILFTIFRDNYLFDDAKFDTRCSFELSFDELVQEAIKYGYSLADVEDKLFRRIEENGVWLTYIATFGTWSVSEAFLTGIEKSIEQYYKNKDDPLLGPLLSDISKLRMRIFGLTKMLEDGCQKESWF